MTRYTKNNTPAYHKLFAWQKADLLAREVYRATLNFPKAELYGLTSQIRRAVLSVVLNIIEGHARQNKNEFRQFLKIAYGSLAEVEYLLVFTKEQGYLTQEESAELEIKRRVCGQALWSYLNRSLDYPLF